MASRNHDQAGIRAYLLGRLSDEEQQKIEERLMVEDDLFEELEVSKGELIEEFCAKELAQSEHQWFKQHYLVSPEGRQSHVFALALDSLKSSIPAPKRRTWFERFQAFLKTHPLAFAIATSTALVLVVVSPFIFRSTPQTSYAISLKNTISNRTSGDARFPTVPLSPDIGELRITLLLPEGVMRGTDYRVVLDDRSETRSLKATSHDENSVLVVVPTKSLHEGPYLFNLYAIKADGTEQPINGEYRFELIDSSRSRSSPKPQ
ncbi:MAG TPA: hypothetical protein VGN10_04675 [Pyrinomonadaceae bacterium]|jgi:hypothetical protein